MLERSGGMGSPIEFGVLNQGIVAHPSFHGWLLLSRVRVQESVLLFLPAKCHTFDEIFVTLAALVRTRAVPYSVVPVVTNNR